MKAEKRFRWLAPLLFTLAWLLFLTVQLFTACGVADNRSRKDKPTERPANYVRAKHGGSQSGIESRSLNWYEIAILAAFALGFLVLFLTVAHHRERRDREMDELEKFRNNETHNYGESRRYLAEAVELVQDMVDLYVLLADLVRESKASGESVWTGSRFINACRRDLVLAMADILKTRLTDSSWPLRRAIEVAAFTAKMAKDPHLVEVWAKAADDERTYDDYRKRFRRKLFPLDDSLLAPLGERYDILSKMVHPSIYSLARSLSFEKKADGATVIWTAFFDVIDDGDPLPMVRTFFWAVGTHVLILQVFARVLAEAINHDRNRWEDALGAFKTKAKEKLSRWADSLESGKGPLFD